jgi:hypothetical protein
MGPLDPRAGVSFGESWIDFMEAMVS